MAKNDKLTKVEKYLFVGIFLLRDCSCFQYFSIEQRLNFSTRVLKTLLRKLRIKKFADFTYYVDDEGNPCGSGHFLTRLGTEVAADIQTKNNYIYNRKPYEIIS